MNLTATRTLQGHILTPHGFVLGQLQLGDDGRIVSVEGEPQPESAVRASDLPVILPGFIDLHVHGGGGRDIMEGAGAIAHIARMHARHGTTALLATTVTAPVDALARAMADLGPACAHRAPDAARVLGVHLEGPFINPGKLGAQPAFARQGGLTELMQLHALAPIRLITLAPEVEGHLDWIPQLLKAGFRVQLGHSAGTYEDGVAALERGASGFTHLFNAISGLHHRAPGMVGAALAHARYAEIIPDLVHVHPGAILAALRAIPCLYCVTDSTSAAGMPDGPYRLGSQPVTKCMGGVRLADGTLAGSTLTMDQALRNLLDIGLGIEDASRRMSTHAADHLGLHDRGRLAAGCWADVVVLSPRHWALQQVFIEGESIDIEDAE